MGYYSEPPWERPAREVFAELEAQESRIYRDRLRAAAVRPLAAERSHLDAGASGSAAATVPPTAEETMPRLDQSL